VRCGDGEDELHVADRIKEEVMSDKLTELYEEWKKENPLGFPGQPRERPDDDFKVFQGGFTAGAVSMRGRAVKIAQASNDKNDTINRIGALSDIPE
jgi:sulfate adenylyltransferase subunit 1 (EFTu-like GTPase family)